MGYAGHIYYEEQGQGYPLVLLHGHTLDHRMWQDLLPVLTPHGRVITPDLAGHGRSSFSPDCGSMADDVAALMDHLGIRAAAICGLSMGGGVAVSFALRYPERCSALIPVDAALNSYRFPTWQGARPYAKIARSEGLAPALEAWLADALFAPAMTAPVGEQVRAIVREFPGDAWLGRAPAQAPDVPPDHERLGEIQAPTLVVVGEHDLPDFQQIADLLAAGIPGARKAVIPGAGHLAPMERPEAFAAELRRFHQEVSAR
jgi:3-oxoadipate enol-lactonase